VGNGNRTLLSLLLLIKILFHKRNLSSSFVYSNTKRNTMIPIYTQKEFDASKSRDKLPLKCKQCGKTFLKAKNEIQSFLSRNNPGRKGDFCSQRCVSDFNRPPIFTKCTNCNKEIKIQKSRLKENNFCSRSCAAKLNGKKYPKRKRTRLCSSCGEYIGHCGDLCRKCYMKKLRIQSDKKNEEYGEKTIQDFKSIYARHKYQSIRNHAHRIATQHNLDKKCAVCGYSIHTQLCHIKDISDFNKLTKLKVVNDISNLVFLCPNHHWELDNNIITL